MQTKKEWLQEIAENEDINIRALPDNFNDAIVGVIWDENDELWVVYDFDKSNKINAEIVDKADHVMFVETSPDQISKSADRMLMAIGWSFAALAVTIAAWILHAMFTATQLQIPK